MRNRRRLRWILIALIGLAASTPCILIALSIFIPSIQFESSLKVYPNAREVSHGDYDVPVNTSNFYSVRYYWTSDPTDTVKTYYQAFTTPFAGNRALFYPTGAQPSLESLRRNECYDGRNRPILTCIEVQVLDFGSSNVLFPTVVFDGGVDAFVPTVQPTPALNGGTLIIYGYYTEEF